MTVDINSGYYNKNIGHTVDINEVTNPPLVENFPSLTYEEIQIINDAPLSSQATYVKLGKFGEVMITANLKKQLNEFLNSEAARDEQIFGTGLKVSTIGNAVPGDAPEEGSEKGTLRWPSDAIDTKTDYVFFQFGKYLPPFSRDVNELREDGKIAELEKKGKGEQIRNYLRKNSTTSATYEMYRNSEALDVAGRTDVMLPIPQDLSNEIQAQWQGKQFTATGRAATAALAAGQFSYAKEVVGNIAGNAKALQTALNTAVLNSIPGVGGNISFNDVSGSTRGIVINPNAELLYDSPEMREIGMIFKLVAKNQKESDRMTDFLIEFGVNKNSVLSENKSRNTRENAVFSKKIMDEYEIKSIVLVTSNIHMKRSIKVFEKLNYKVFPYNSQIFRIPKKNSEFDPFIFFPNVENLFISSQIIYEYFALLLYKIFGWI